MLDLLCGELEYSRRDFVLLPVCVVCVHVCACVRARARVRVEDEVDLDRVRVCSRVCVGRVLVRVRASPISVI